MLMAHIHVSVSGENISGFAGATPPPAVQFVSITFQAEIVYLTGRDKLEINISQTCLWLKNPDISIR
jgi:hypothetical protein